MAATVYFVWSRKKGEFSGPYPSSADATTASRRIKAHSIQAGGNDGESVADTHDIVSVTKN